MKEDLTEIFDHFGYEEQRNKLFDDMLEEERIQAFVESHDANVKYDTDLDGYLYASAIHTGLTGTTEVINKIRLQNFDADGYYLNKIEGKNAYQAMHGYKKHQRRYQELQNSEIASMLVLHDYFGFRIKRIRRFIETIRAKYDTGIKSYMEYLEYLE